MRVLIDTSYASRGPTGTGVYIDRLVDALRATDVEVLTARNPLRGAPAGGPLRSVANYLSDRAWTGLALPLIAWRRGADVIHHPLPARAPLAPCPQVVTVHDLAFVNRPELFDRRYARWAARAHRAAARRAAAVVCVSEATRDDVLRAWHVAAERIVVAHHGPGQVAGDPPARREARHFLYVGDDEPRKNLPALLAAYGRYRAGGGRSPLVLAGSATARAQGVQLAGRPSRIALEQLHADAIALVHAAVEEGFGLTVLEAFALGTPVIAVRTAAIAEVCADAALLVAPDDAAALAAAMSAIESDPALRERLSSAGLARSRDFSWARSARAHIAAYTLADR